jgi:protein-tyrosine phosphatase
MDPADDRQHGEPDRRVVLEGSYNFRDIGGYEGAGGRRVRWGRVFRADHPGELSDADVELVRSLGLRTVCDLRRPVEQSSMPSRLVAVPGVVVHDLPIGGTAAERYAYTQRMLDGEIRSFSVDDVIDVYARLLGDFPGALTTAVGLAAHGDGLPMLVHCTAGKDRTGLVIAAILQLLGVPDDVIADDYELSEAGHHAGRVQQLLGRLEAVGVRREVMLGTLAIVRERWGGFAGYLCEVGGAGEDLAERLQAQLLEPALRDARESRR